MKHYTLLILASLTLSYTSCKESSSHSVSGDTSAENSLSPEKHVQSDIIKIFEATSSGDVDVVLSFTHPAVIEEMGGMAQAKTLTNIGLQQIKEVKMKIGTPTFPSEPSFFNGEVNEFVVVPILTQMTINTCRIERSNFQLGVRKIGSTDWKYLDGNQLNQIDINSLIPDFPKDYKLPQ